jgi:hypothetical protein
MAIQLKSSGDVAASRCACLSTAKPGRARRPDSNPPRPRDPVRRGGLLSIAGSNLPFVEINSVETLRRPTSG